MYCNYIVDVLFPISFHRLAARILFAITLRVDASTRPRLLDARNGRRRAQRRNGERNGRNSWAKLVTGHGLRHCIHGCFLHGMDGSTIGNCPGRVLEHCVEAGHLSCFLVLSPAGTPYTDPCSNKTHSKFLAMDLHRVLIRCIVWAKTSFFQLPLHWRSCEGTQHWLYKTTGRGWHRTSRWIRTELGRIIRNG